jgi:hypothetical protein
MSRYRRGVRSGKLLQTGLAGLALLLVLGAVGAQAVTHTYPVTVTIKVDRANHRLSGSVLSDAPAQFCEQATVRVRRVMPGRDKVVARVFPNDLAEWRFTVGRNLRGARVYAEVSQYHLPSRPVVCLGDRSRTVTAP